MADKGATLFFRCPLRGIIWACHASRIPALASLVLDASIRLFVVLIVFDKFRNNTIADVQLTRNNVDVFALITHCDIDQSLSFVNIYFDKKERSC